MTSTDHTAVRLNPQVRARTPGRSFWSLAVALVVLTGTRLLALPLLEAPALAGIPAGVSVDVIADFGAKADGQTDDTKAIQNAIDSVGAQGGGTVYFPEGIYLVNTLSDRDPLTYPKTDPGLGGSNGFNHQLWARSRVRLLGAGARASVLKMPAGDPADATDRLLRQNRAIFVMGNPHYDAAHQDLTQSDIEVAHLGFDLDNGGGRRALQIRFPVRSVRVHHCEGFQSGVENAGVLQDVQGRDNHFFNMASYGNPVDLGAGRTLVDIPEDIAIDHCTVSGVMQLTSDGGAGVRNLWIHHNTVKNPQEFGIAVTYTGTDDALFEDVVIEDNVIESPTGAGIMLGSNYTPHNLPLDGIRLHVWRRITVRRNLINIRSTPVDGYTWSKWAPEAGGIIFSGAELDTQDVSITDNVLTCENVQNIGTSRQAFRIGTWDMNWETTWEENHGGNTAKVNAPGIDSTTGQLLLPLHGLAQRHPVQLFSTDVVPLPEGIEAFKTYAAKVIDRDHFTLVDPATGTNVQVGVSTKGGRFQVRVVPVIKNLTLARNTVSGVWDWDIALWDATEDLTLSDNSFCSRIDVRGSHDRFLYRNNVSTGTMDFNHVTLRGAKLEGNSWALNENTSGRQFAPAILTFANAGNYWRELDVALTGNSFSYTPPTSEPGRTFRAVWLCREDWRPPGWLAWSGVASLGVTDSKLLTPRNLSWSIAPDFVARWSGNDGVNTLGALGTP